MLDKLNKVWRLGSTCCALCYTAVAALLLGVAFTLTQAAEPTESPEKPSSSKADASKSEKSAKKRFSTGSSDPLIQYLNEQIHTAWEENEVQPSAAADDAEWLRRVYLDIAGHIPPVDKVGAFAKDSDPSKRSKLIDSLLADPDYVQNFSHVWTTTLLGRNTPLRTNRSGLQKFLRECFAKNRPWNDMVYDMLTAEGRFDEKGEVNFLLGQLMGNPDNPEYAVEATGKTARIFLCMQVQCTQCHNHPFNDWKQDQFWAFNSFLRQIRRVDHRKYDPKMGREVDDYSELVYQDTQKEVFYENRSGAVFVAYPKYFDQEIDRDPRVNRREELAKLMAKDDSNHQLARAMVNRTWAHFFGYAFTRPVDDMGPHTAVSHPSVLDRLTDEFVKSGYDVKQLIRWVANTEAYNLTSQSIPKKANPKKNNEIDNPAAGEVPLFSHMYVKTMDVEQLYESLLVATNAHKTGQGSYEEAQKQRDDWMKKFLVAFGGNGDEEPTMFSGTIPQALMMMNGSLIEKAISAEKGGYLRSVLEDPHLKSDENRIQALFLSALGRLPSRQELGKMSSHVKQGNDALAAYQDLYWALLNSNEFIVNH